jgi:hypothetical protein
LSGYQQVSFWIRSDLIGTIAAGVHELRLCSDTTGDVTVNTVSIPAMNATSRWMPFTVDLGTNLGSSIQSIALYVVTDTGAQTLIFSNIIACKASSAADSLTLTSLIGKNTTGETWWGIQSINGTRVMFDADTNATPINTTVRGYYGTSETVTTWKRETIKLGPAASAFAEPQIIQESGTSDSEITYSGGWDRTAMTTQTLETWLDGQNGNGIAISFQSTGGYISLSNIAGVRWNTAINHGFTSSSNLGIKTNAVTGNNNITGFAFTPSAVVLSIAHAVANSTTGVSIGNISSKDSIVAIGASNSNGSIGVNITGNCIAKTNAANNPEGIRCSTSVKLIYDSNLQGNTSGIVINNQSANIRNTLISDTSEISNSGLSSEAFSQNHDQTTDNHKIFLSGALISSATDQRKTASGISWKIQPTSTNRSSTWPVTLSLAKVACAANSLVTVKAWMRRSNTGLTMRLVCKGGQIAGVASDVVDAMTAAADTWAEQTITFTPTEVGVVEITAEAWGGTTFSGWVDDMTISQA